MKKYLIRAAFNPIIDNTVDPNACLWHRYVGGNTGNLMFAYGVMNVLTTEESVFDTTPKFSFTDSEIAEINEQYDAFILPMADAFRPDFIHSLKKLTSSIRKMSIPVVLIGVGVRADYEPDFKQPFPFDNDVRDFIKAVLDKSPLIGLRGHITGEYLKHLGFCPERDFTAIGCPSLYMYGDSIKTKELPKQINKLAINTNGYYPFDNIHKFLQNTMQEIPDLCLIQQIDIEFRDMYIGKWWIPTLIGILPNPQEHMIVKGNYLKKLYKEDRVRVFFDVPSWINIMKPFDLFVGNRFHGSVASILAGLPHVLIPFNARTREMVEYHKITCLKPDEIDSNMSIIEKIDDLDIYSFSRNQNKNVRHYVDFLNTNGLKNIFSNRTTYEQGESLMEKRIQEKAGTLIGDIDNSITPLKSLNVKKRIKRIIEANIYCVKNKYTL